MKTTYMRATVTSVAALGLAFAGAAAQASTTIVAGFDFENLPTLASGSAAAPATIAADLGANAASGTLKPTAGSFVGNNPDNATPSYAYTTPGDDAPGTSTPSSYTLRLGIGQYPMAGAPPVNNGSTIIFGASNAGYNNISVSYNTYTSSTSAFQTEQFGYSTTGPTGTFTLLPSYTIPIQGTTKAPASTPAGYTTETFNLSSVAGLADDSNAAYEIIFSGAPAGTSTAAPNARLDNVLINGTADISPAPEPSQVAGLSFFLLGISALAFRARKRANTAV